MRAMVFDQPGDESVLHIGEAPAPALGAERRPHPRARRRR